MNQSDEATPVIDLGEIPRRPSRHRVREPIGLVLLAVAVVAAAVFAGGRIGAEGPEPAAPTPGPGLVVPAVANAGERLPVLAYRLPGRCGGTELRLDGAPAAQRLTRYAAAADRLAVFLTLDVPAAATPGRHVVELVAPVCDGADERVLATAAVDVWVGPNGQSTVIGSDGENGHSS